MTDLMKQLEQALIPMHPNDRIRFADMSYGIQCHADRLAPLHAALLKCVEALEFYGDKNNWNRDLDGWRHDIVEKDLDDETLNDWTRRFSGTRAREALADLRKALETVSR